MKISKLIFVLMAAMPCFSFAVSAQTTTTDISKAIKKEDDKTSSAASIVAGNSGEGKTSSSDSPATGSEAKNSVAADPQGTSDHWEFIVSAYIWLARIDGKVGVGTLTTDIDPGVSDILSKLNFGYMGTFEAKKHRLLLLNDLMYISLEETKPTTGPAFSALKVNIKTFLLSPVVGIRLVEKNGSSLYAIAGIRFWHTSLRLEAFPNQLAGRLAESSKNWTDVIGGLRGRVHVTRLFSLLGRGDFGGGGSDFTYQLFGGVGIDVSRRASLFAGYRYLYIKYTRGNSLFDGALNGAVLGAAFRF